MALEIANGGAFAYRVGVRTLVALLLAATSATAVAQSDSARGPSAGFRGRVINQLDSTAVRSADVRLYFIDSGRVVKNRSGEDSLDVFLDSTRSRVSATDSLGAFSIGRVAAGRYMLQIRRIGFAPVIGGVVLDTGIVQTTLVMQPTSMLLAKVRVVETSVDVVKERLERNGFQLRSRMGMAATFIDRAEILRRKPFMIAEVLQAYGIYQADIVLDRMPMQYDDLKSYPADLVIGIEVYRHNRPSEFNGTRGADNLTFAPSGGPGTKPLVVIWTFIPGSS